MGKIIDPLEIAKKWFELHKDKRNLTKRFYEDKLIENKIGAAGEIAFAKKYNLLIYWKGLSLKPYGDDGIDFFIPSLGSIDVKTARKPINLLEKKGKVKADYYVLSKYIADDNILFIGWHHGLILKNVTPRDIGGYGILSHYIHHTNLIDMQKLEDLISEHIKLPKPENQLNLFNGG